MKYFIFPIPFIIYFELLGRSLFAKINKKPLEFSFLIGFIFAMATMYITLWPITAFGESFYLLAGVVAVEFLLSLIFIISQIKKIKVNINYKHIILFVLVFVFEMYISYTRTLGQTHAFDTLYYLNFVSFNIENPELNSLHVHFGTTPNFDDKKITYFFQSYYYFIGVVIYSIRKILSVVNVSFETLPAFAWGFQIICHFFIIATTFTIIDEIKSKNKIFNIAAFILLSFFIGNFYYNNVFGFIGNTYRMSIHSIGTIYLFRYFKEKDDKDLYLFYLTLIGMCGVSSTGTFASIFILFGLFFTLCRERKNIIKEYLLVLLIPAYNIISTKLGVSYKIFILVALLFTVAWFLNDLIIKVFKNKKIQIGLVVSLFIVMATLSFRITKNIFATYTFTNNLSEIADMSWDYFMFNDLRHWLFNTIVLIPFAYFLKKNCRHPFGVAAIVMIIVVYNPLCCTFMNEINWVYYRTYDIFINQFTIIYFLYLLINDIKSLKLQKTLVVCFLVVSIILSYIQVPRYYHASFIPDDDYNPIYKIENTELELIYNIRRLKADYNYERIKIINTTFFMPSFIENSSYLYGKEKRFNHMNQEDGEYGLYLIFFPFDHEYDFFYPKNDKPEYEKVDEFLDKSTYDILIVPYSLYYNDSELGYRPLVELVDETGRSTSEYSTSKYAVYFVN